jgi:ATP-dependent protease HslVU (ClpYQ) peptidase subunit
MTCIVGVAHEGVTYIGGDSCASVDGDLLLISNGKVFELEAFKIGMAGERRASEIVRYSFAAPSLKEVNDADLDRLMATEFADSLRVVFKAKGALSVSDEVENFSSTMIVGVRSRIYFVSANFSVTPVLDGHWSTGSGSDFALGSLHSTKEQPPRERIMSALSAAAHYADGVRPPFHIIPE